MNLFNQFLELYHYREWEWNYYDQLFINPIENDGRVDEFIRQYFIYGEKEAIIYNRIEGLEQMRQKHTISAFFLGILIREKLCNTLYIESEHGCNYPFSYLWFLVCLFHDMGYSIENDWKKKFDYKRNPIEYEHEMWGKQCIRYFVRDHAFTDLGILYPAPYRFSCIKFPFNALGKYNSKIVNYEYPRNDIGVKFSNGIIIKKSMYKRCTILDYLEFCKVNPEINHYDHGIVGGLWFYDSAVKNYYREYLKIKDRKPYESPYDFHSEGNLHFCAEQGKVFAYLADCIVAHNMWPATEATREIYKECELNELIQPKFKKITFGKNPMLYILAIADTIEPVKTYSGLELGQRTIWEGIDFSISEKKIIISILDKRLPFKYIANKVRDLSEWTDVTVEINPNDESIKIQMRTDY